MKLASGLTAFAWAWLPLGLVACVIEASAEAPARAPLAESAVQETPPSGGALIADAPGRSEPKAAPAEPPPAEPPPPQPLAVPGFPDAVVQPPDDAASVRPVAIVLHGLGGRPEPNCAAWANITQGAAFVVCPRGAPDPAHSTYRDARYTLPGGDTLRRQLDATLRALTDRFPGRADASRPLLCGFSLGASEAAFLAQSDPARFPRIALLEGGVDAWQDWNVAQFAHGGERVLFGCGSGWCTPSAEGSSSRIAQGGLDSRVVFEGVGHTNAPLLQAAVRDALGWLLTGDARWQPAGRLAR
jgi:hypothetical protein